MSEIDTPPPPTQLRPLLNIGEPAPWFTAPVLDGNPNWVFSSIGGRSVLMLFYGSASQAEAATALEAVKARRHLFDDDSAVFFGVSVDPTDAQQKRIAQDLPGIRHFLDYDGAVSTMFGASGPGEPGRITYRPHFLLLDHQLRVQARFGIDNPQAALDAVAAANDAPRQDWAPIISVPRILEPELCKMLIDAYDASGGEPSGFMRDVDGKTTLVLDHGFKRRSDYTIEDARVRAALVKRIQTRLVPVIQRSFQFEPTRIERYIVARYDASEGGFFRAHRDNTTRGTAHRRFAVTINLNGDYDGGDLRLPEFGMRTYRAPIGGAVVFSCSLLHEATPVTRGTRYAFLPFLYDEAAARQRESNNDFLGDGVLPYIAGNERSVG